MVVNKKGDSPGMVVALAVIFAAAIILVVGARVMGNIFDELKDKLPTDSDNNNASVEAINVIQDNTVTWLDYAFLITFIAVSLGVIVSSVYVDTHPAFMVGFIVTWIMLVFLSPIMSNIFTEFIGEEEFVLVSQGFTFTRAIMGKLPVIIFGLTLFVIVVLYGKGKVSGGAAV